MKRGLPRERRLAKIQNLSVVFGSNELRLAGYDDESKQLKQQISRLQINYEMEALIERAKDEGLAEHDAIEALEHAIGELKDFRERARDAIIGGRLF